MRVSLVKGIIRKCECCNFNYYERICIKCRIIYTTRNGNDTKYCSKSCGRSGKKQSEESKIKVSKTLKKNYAKKRKILKSKTSQ